MIGDRRRTESSETPGVPHRISMRKNKGLQDERPEIKFTAQWRE
jgi:hypothetical protein